MFWCLPAKIFLFLSVTSDLHFAVILRLNSTNKFNLLEFSTRLDVGNHSVICELSAIWCFWDDQVMPSFFVILTTPKVFAVSMVILFRIFSLFLASFTLNGITLGFIFKLTVKFYKIQIHHFSLIWLLPWNCFSIKSVESKLKICTSITCSTADLKSSVMVGRGKNKFCLCLRNYGPNYISTWTNWS